MPTFDEYKNEVSIIQVAEHIGYLYNKSKGKITPTYELQSNGKVIDQIIIRNPYDSSRQIYFDRNNRGGDLIAFIKNHLSHFSNFQHINPNVRVNMVLEYFHKTPIQSIASQLKKEAKPFNIERYKQIETQINDLGYLTNERKISPKTVEAFLPYIQRTKDLEIDGDFKNISFPFRKPGETAILNYEFRNYSYKGQAEGGNKTEAVWIADFTPNRLMATNVYVAESALDIMSFYQLEKAKGRLHENSVFVSTGGFVCDNQIKNLITYYTNAQINTCFDKDVSGLIYDMKVACIKSGKEFHFYRNPENIEIKLDDKNIIISNEELSYEKFKQQSGLPKNIITIHKPPTGFKDFNDVLMQNSTIKMSNKL